MHEILKHFNSVSPIEAAKKNIYMAAVVVAGADASEGFKPHAG